MNAILLAFLKEVAIPETMAIVKQLMQQRNGKWPTVDEVIAKLNTDADRFAKIGRDFLARTDPDNQLSQPNALELGAAARRIEQPTHVLPTGNNPVADRVGGAHHVDAQGNDAGPNVPLPQEPTTEKKLPPDAAKPGEPSTD